MEKFYKGCHYEKGDVSVTLVDFNEMFIVLYTSIGYIFKENNDNSFEYGGEVFTPGDLRYE